MASKDILTKRYMQEPTRFADFFNSYVYSGKEVIDANKLLEVDTSNITVIHPLNGSKPITIQKYRDILKKSVLMQSDKAYYLFLGIENQTDVHYAMPVRNMLYNALVYTQQVETIARYNRDNKRYNENSGEFLSGFTKLDKLIPVITVTVYWGTIPWDAPITLKEMLTDIDSESNAFIDDINCNLFSIIDAEDLPSFKTELNELFQLLRARNDVDALIELLNNDSRFYNISKDTATIMREFADIKLPRKNKEGKYNMCKAIEDLKKENQDTKAIELIKNLMLTSKKSFDDACSMLCISKSDIKRYRKMI